MREGKGYNRAAVNFALYYRRSVVEIGNRFYQSQTQARTFRTARGIDPIEPIEQSRNMLCGYSGARIADRNLRPCGARDDRDMNSSTGRSEAKCIFYQIAYGPPKQHRVSVNATLSLTSNGDLLLFCDGFIEARDLAIATARQKRALNMTCAASARAERKISMIQKPSPPNGHSITRSPEGVPRSRQGDFRLAAKVERGCGFS